MKENKILEVNNLTVSFKTDNGLVKAVRGVSFDLTKGETLCIVGESGSGKSVTSKAIMGILAKNAIVEDGSIMYEGKNLLEISESEYVSIRGHKIGMIFQDPLSSLNPIVRIGKQITESTLINSNKLKLMYNNLISKEFMDYQNILSSRDAKIKKLNFEFETKIENLTKEILDKTQLKQLKKEEKNILKKNILEEKLACKEKLIIAKEKLKDASALAKVKVKEYKLQCKNEYLSKVTSYEKELVKEFDKVNLEFKDYDFTEKVVKLNLDLNNKIEEISSLKEELKATKKFNEEKLTYLKDSLKTKQEELKNIKKEIYETENAHKLALNKVQDKFNDLLSNVHEEYIDKLKITKKEAKRRALEIMKEVGIPQPEKRFRQYPFEFSGGMRQRIVIAIALTANPDVLICDEPTTALDVTIQAQILELINKLKKERNLSCVFITHDLGVVANMADRVAVMYAGKVVEYGKVDEIFYEPKHPYTWALLSSIPDVDSNERLDAISGTPPNMIYPPQGDAFAARNKYAMEIDYKYQPPFFKVSDTHYAATWLLHPDAPKVEMPSIVKERISKAIKVGDFNEHKD